MKRTVLLGSVVVIAGVTMSAAALVMAQQTWTGPGAPGATESLKTQDLPPGPAKVGGVVKPNAADSKPYWSPLTVPPKGAPNVLLIMTDDVGFSAPSTFGGSIPTPALDRVAKAGLRYTRFHTTALSSPTRAALLTGRNHHSVANGAGVDQATGFPGYTSVIPRDAVAVGEILRENGYDTSWFGKDHNVPSWETSQAGPFTNWPTGPVKGFNYFYGFVGEDTSQWQPGNLYRDTVAVQPYLGRPGWNLVTAMADEAIGRVRMLAEVQPSRPFFIYYAPGGTHAPHHAPKEWADKFKGKFDAGWNAERERTFANQKKLGIIPANAELTAWPASIPKWEALSAEQKKLYARQAEVYAGYLAYTDNEIGRVIQAIADLGRLEDTLVVYISGSSGASAEGSLEGAYNAFADVNGVTPTAAMNMKFYDAWGSEQTYPEYAAGWALAFDTPYQGVKQDAAHLGGTRNGMVIAWPRRIKDAGGVRAQFHHVIDVVPTILEAAHIAQPKTVDGIKQRPIEGVSMAYTWDKAGAGAAARRHTQYFEMLGSRAVYHDGWIAAAPSPTAPWLSGKAQQPRDVMNGFKWELYDLDHDWTEARDLAAKNPAKLQELQKLFVAEATRYRVFPLDATTTSRTLGEKPSYAPGRSVFSYAGTLTGVPLDAGAGAPDLLNRSYSIAASVEIPKGGAEGMLVTGGGRYAGYGLYLLKGRPIFTWNLLQLERVKWSGKDALGPGAHTVEFAFKYDGPGTGKGGTGTLKVDGKVVDSHAMGRSLPSLLPTTDSFDVGMDLATPVDDGDYHVPFRFTGKLASLTIKAAPPPGQPTAQQ
jgi:arylsulfatase